MPESEERGGTAEKTEDGDDRSGNEGGATRVEGSVGGAAPSLASGWALGGGAGSGRRPEGEVRTDDGVLACPKPG